MDTSVRNCYLVDVVDILSQLPACIPLAKSASLCEFQFLPCSNPFDGQLCRRSTADSSAVLDDLLVHSSWLITWMQRVLGSLMCILHSCPHMIHAIHLLACFVHN